MTAGFSVTISAVDRATETLNAVNKRMMALTAPAERFNKALSKFGDVSGIRRLSAGIGDLGRGAMATAERMSRILAPLSAITGALSLAGLVRLTDQWSVFGQQLGFSAARIGISASRLQSLQGAARMAGASAGSLTSGLQSLQDTLTNAAAGRDAEAVVMFRQLGIEFRGLTAADALPKLADRIAAIRNPTLQAMVATKLFGAAGEELLPFLRRGSAGMREYEDAARRHGLINEKGVKAAGDFQRAQTNLKMAVEGLGYAVAERLAPVLLPMLNDLAGWIDRHRTDIAETIGRIADAFKSWIDGGGLDRLTEQIGHLIERVDAIAQAFGGWKVAAIALGAVLTAKVLAPVLRLSGLLVRMGSVIGWARLLTGGLWGAVTQLHGDTDPNATPDGVYPGFKPDMDGSVHNFRNDVWNPLRRAAGWVGDKLGITGGNASAGGVMQQLQALGWSPEAAAGLAANFQAESGFNPALVGDNGQAYGIGQWHPDRQAEFQRLFGRPIQGSSLAQQLAFADWELRAGKEQRAGRMLMGAKTATEAGQIGSLFYERPRDRWGQAQARGRLAQDIYRAGGASVAGPGAPGGGTATVNVVIRGAPAGTTATTTSSGNLATTARIERPSLGTVP